MNYNLKFTKYNACGNDFVLIDELIQKPVSENLKGKIAELMSHRKYGIGSDGVLYVVKSLKADFAMRMFNPDGTEDMCGNGLRSVALYAFKYLAKNKKKLMIDSVAGVKEAVYLQDGTVSINMGRPILEYSSLPLRKKIAVSDKENNNYISSSLKVAKKKINFVLVSMGTPHAVIFTDKKTIDKYFLHSGEMENNNIFSEKVNIDWVEIIDKNNIKVRIWERGVGETLSCGTGACSVMTAAKLLGLVNNNIKVHFKGGDISIKWKGVGSDLFMVGGAEKVYTGNIKIDIKSLQR